MQIGFDVGDTLLDKQGRTFSGYSPEDRIKLFKPFAGCFEAIKQLAETVGNDHLYIISKCDEADEEKIMKWLKIYGFISEKMIPEKNVYFCRERKDKAPIIAELGLDVFVDDRIEILESLGSGMKKMLFINDINRKEVIEQEGIIFNDWSQVFDLLNLV